MTFEGSLGPGVGVELEEGVGDSSGIGVGEGEDLCFFLGEGLGEESRAGVGEDFFFFFGETEALGSAVSAGVGLPEAFLFFEEDGDGDFSGVADGFGVGDLSASSFFFGVVELLRCFRGAGVGVGAKIFLILLPSDSSARVRSATPRRIAIKKRVLAILLAGRMELENSTGTCACAAREDTNLRPIVIQSLTFSPTRPKQLCLSGCRHPCSRAGNSRSANALDNPAARDQAEASQLRGCYGIAKQ